MDNFVTFSALYLSKMITLSNIFKSFRQYLGIKSYLCRQIPLSHEKRFL